jgi:nanoRNase/pAp phosphatase (c-di-AMP/oligoRNAs hydrolase)
LNCLVLADHRIFYGIFARSAGAGVDAHFWLEKGERTPYPELRNVFRGDPADPATYAHFDPEEEHAAVLYFQARADAERAAKAIERALPRTSFLFLGMEEHAPAADVVARGRVRLWAEMVGSRLADEVRALVTRWRVERVREIFAGAQRVAVLLQDDPDPDAIASGLCFRNIIGRNRATAPLVTFGAVTRPENREMLRLLDLGVESIAPEALAAFDRVACIDVQPAVFGDRLGRDVDAVIDHHPEQTGYRTKYRDIRAVYGATSTILTEYLRAAGEEVNQKQATALYYGIKSDTLFLDRECCDADMEAFQFLYPRVNLSVLRRIEKPAIPRDSLRLFGRALEGLEIENGLSFAFMGEVEREDVIPQLAEFLLQVEGAEWSVAAGIAAGEGDAGGELRLVASVRNAGYQRAAGDVVKRAFGDLGSAGGHRSMAKAVIPLARFLAEFGAADEATVRKVFFTRFLAEATSGEARGSAEGAGAGAGTRA